MFCTRYYLGLAAATGFAVLSSHAVLAFPSACKSSALDMVRSCQAEKKEEHFAVRARCNSISDVDARRSCNADAGVARREAGEACVAQRDARKEVCAALDEGRYDDPLVDSGIAFIDPDDIGDSYDNNPYVMLETGHTHVLRSEELDEDTGETSIELIVVHATDEAREIEGVPCRVVVDVVVEPEWDDEEGKWEFIPVEVTDDWFAQDVDDNVYYCGEIARNYEDGILRDLDGSFEAGIDLAEGGFLTLAAPASGEAHRQEYALGEAEDIVEYLSLDADPADEGIGEDQLSDEFKCSTGGNTCLMTYDYSPLEPEHAEYKYYLHGTGFVLAASLQDGEISEDGSEWLVCSYDSLAAAFADGSSCGFDMFEDPEGEFAPMDVREELLVELCDLHDEFCDDGEAD